MAGRVRGLAAMLAGASVLAAGLGVGMASVASAAACTIVNDTTGVVFRSLQTAVNAAAPGDTLRIRNTCTGNVTIGKRLTLVGTGTSPTIRGNSGRPLTITAGPVTIDGLRITGGVATNCFAAPAGVACGGGILTSARVNLKRSSVDGNLATANLVAHGGGLTVADGGSLVVTSSVIRDNEAQVTSSAGTAMGGGVSAVATVTIRRSTVTGNTANGPEAFGGGIHADAALTMTDSVVTDNVAIAETDAAGGGIHGTDVVRLTRCTIARNSATAVSTGAAFAQGGGVRADEAAIANSTIVGNRVQSLAVAVGDASGGGASVDAGTVIASTVAGNVANVAGGLKLGASVQVGTTIIAGNTAPSSGRDCQAALGAASLGRNLVGDGDGCGGVFVNGTQGDKVGTAAAPIAPKLGPLADNGGLTPTRALKTGSPAIDAAGRKPCSTTTDQRGVTRPKGPRCDIGAFERG